MNINEKNYNAVLQEAHDCLRAQGVSILGDGYKEVACNAALFENYVDLLTEGADANSAATMAQLMQNTNAAILTENSMTGIQPVASLSMPVIRKLWPKFALKEAVDTEVATLPRFVVAYTKPYMFKGDDPAKKVYLPRGLRGAELGYGDESQLDESLFDAYDALKKEYTAEHNINMTAGAAVVVDFEFVNGKDGDKDPHVYVVDTPSHAKLQPLDELIIVSAKCGEEVIKIGKRLGVYGNGVYAFKNGQLIVQFDGANRKATFAAVGTFAEEVVLKVKAAVSSEYNEESWSVGFDVLRQDIDIPTGQHLNASLPVEGLNDLMALYNIDGTKETVDLMTNVFANKLELEVLDFLRNSFINQPSNEAFAGYPEASAYTVAFDCKPAAGFAGSPKAWREELKPLIDHLAQKIKNETYLQSGVFNIVANPIDAQILANIDWQFRGGQGGNMDGVDVDYSIGTYVAGNAYKVIASPLVPQGAMYLVFLPSAKTQMTYKYYAYSFSTELGYVDPNRSRVPSIMMTKRHQFHEFMPAIGAIVIQNNDGRGHFNQYVAHKEWTEQ